MPRVSSSDDGSATWYRSPCLGQCDRAPAALLSEAGAPPLERAASPAAADVLALLAGGEPGPEPVAVPAQEAGELRLLRACRSRRPAAPRRVPGERRVRGAAARLRARARRGRPRAEGLEAAGPRWRRVPDRRQVGGSRPAARPAPLPRVQRRRVRAGHVQGSCAARRRPVRRDRGDDDRGVRDQLRARLRVPARRVPARRTTFSSMRSRRPGAVGTSGGTSSARGWTSTSRCGRARARTSAARRRRSSTPSKGSGASRATSRRSPSSRGSSPSRRSSTTSRRSSTCIDVVLAQRALSTRRPDGGLDRDEALLRLRSRRAPGRLRGALRRDARET